MQFDKNDSSVVEILSDVQLLREMALEIISVHKIVQKECSFHKGKKSRYLFLIENKGWSDIPQISVSLRGANSCSMALKF